jgi:hypothetical protein
MEEITTYKITAKDDPKDRINVEIGDSKQPDFYPQIKVMRFDNEVNLSIRLKHNEKNPKHSNSGNSVKWEGKNVHARFTSLDQGTSFEVILPKKPKSNKIEFTLNTKGLDFFYQPPLTKKEIEQGYKRPDNVIGSYAVYISEKKTNYEGGKQYGSGKVGHLYRPMITDSSGKWVWGKLHIEKGIMTKTIPQKFLDNAVYPVKVS